MPDGLIPCKHIFYTLMFKQSRHCYGPSTPVLLFDFALDVASTSPLSASSLLLHHRAPIRKSCRAYRLILQAQRWAPAFGFWHHMVVSTVINLTQCNSWHIFSFLSSFPSSACSCLFLFLLSLSPPLYVWFVTKATWEHSLWSPFCLRCLCHYSEWTVEVLLSFASPLSIEVYRSLPPPFLKSFLSQSQSSFPILTLCNITLLTVWTSLLEPSDLISFSFPCEHMFRKKRKKPTSPSRASEDTFKIAHQPNANCLRLAQHW